MYLPEPLVFALLSGHVKWIQLADKEQITAQTLPLIVEFVELVSDVDEAAIVEHYGGVKASMQDVMAVMSQIIQEAAPKN